jgi:hypothetical protein
MGFEINLSAISPMKVFKTEKGKKKTRGVSHYGTAIYIKKYLKAEEEELWKLKYFTMQKYDLQKKIL